MRQLLVMALVVFCASSVEAQTPCMGDFNGNGQVTIDELVVAVNNALNSCSTPPTATNTPRLPTATNTPRLPTPTNTPRPPTATPTRLPQNGCPWTFDSNVPGLANSCTYSGTFNDFCGGTGQAANWIAGDGLVVAAFSGHNNVVFFGGTTIDEDSATIDVWDVRTDFATAQSLSGLMLLVTAGDGTDLFGIAPTVPPFTLDGCPFTLYEGSFIGLLGQLGAGADVGSPPAAVLDDAQMESAFEAFRALRRSK